MTHSASKRIMTIAAVAMLLAVVMVAPIGEDWDNFVQSDDSDAAIPVVVGWAGVLLVGFFAGLLFADINSEDPQINDAEHAKEYISGMLGNLVNPSTNVSELIGFTSSYFERMGEIAAAEEWSAGSTMNADSILISSSAAKEYATLLLTEYGALDSIFDYTSDLGTSYTLGSSKYDASDMSLDFGLGADVTSADADRVYIYTFEDGDETSGHIHVNGGSATITSSDGKSYTLSAGDNDLKALGIPNGYYELQTGRQYIGSMMSSMSSDKAVLMPAVAIYGSTDPAFVIETSSVGTYNVFFGSTKTMANSISYTVSDKDSSQSADLSMAFAITRNIYNASNRLLSDTVNAASAAWSVFNTAGEASVFVSPSSLMPNLDNMDFTSDQAYLIYMSALQQMSDYFDKASGAFDASDVLVSEDSLDMICHGTIYTDSSMKTQVASGYFTPMCYLRDQSIVVGNTAWMQTGLAMFWEKNADGTYDASSLVVLENGNYMAISSIEYRGTAYITAGEGVTLHVHSLTALSGYDNGKQTPTTSKDTNWLQIVMIVIGILGILLGLLFQRADFVIIGIVMVIVGFLAGSWLWGLIS